MFKTHVYLVYKAKVDFLQLMVNAETSKEDNDEEDSTSSKDTATNTNSDAWKSNRRGLADAAKF